jgi:hypothetical protein
MSLTIAIDAGARSPLEYVKAARITNAMISGRSAVKPEPEMPSPPMTTWIPTSYSAMYGMVATMPVMLTAKASQRLPKRPRTKSPGVM